MAAGDSGQERGIEACVFALQLFLDGLKDGGHFADAHGLEQIVVYADLNGALRILKFAIAADDDDMDAGLDDARRLRQLDARHAVHADIRDEQIDGLLPQIFQRMLAAGSGSDDLKILGKLLNDAAHEAESGHFVVNDQHAIHEKHLPN